MMAAAGFFPVATGAGTTSAPAVEAGEALVEAKMFVVCTAAAKGAAAAAVLVAGVEGGAGGAT